MSREIKGPFGRILVALACLLVVGLLAGAQTLDGEWATDERGPTEEVPAEATGEGFEFETPFLGDVSHLLLDAVVDCVTGEPIDPATVRTQFIFSPEAEPPYVGADVARVVVSAEGYIPVEIVDLQVVEIPLFLFTITLLVPADPAVCLMPESEGVATEDGSEDGALSVELHELERTFTWETGTTRAFTDGSGETTLEFAEAGQQTLYVPVPAGAFVELGSVQLDVRSPEQVTLALSGPLSSVWATVNGASTAVELAGLEDGGLLVSGEVGDPDVALPITIAVSGPCVVDVGGLLVAFNEMVGMDVGFAAVVEGAAGAFTVAWDLGDGTGSFELLPGPETGVSEVVVHVPLPTMRTIGCTVNDASGATVMKTQTVKAEQSDTYVQVFGTFGGKCRYKLPGDTKWRPLTKGLKLPYGTRIETQIGAKAYLKWVENGKRVHAAVIKPLSEMTIGKYVEKKEEESVMSNLGLKVGKVRVRVDKTSLKCDLSVSEPNCVAGVAGTAFESSYDETTDTGTFVVFEGFVNVTNIRTGETVTITGSSDGIGQRATVHGDTIVVDTVTDLDASPGGDWDFDAMFEEEGEQ
ncbi:hypothetical protein KJ567_05390, partial [Candidatus Bipolaricaulota bacterium]|nr:hypothetical protein [Candidatus Bipolaricaulota bacterium]